MSPSSTAQLPYQLQTPLVAISIRVGLLSTLVLAKLTFGAITVVRTSYADVFYARLAQEAIQLWKDGNMWGNTFHECAL